MTTFGGFSRNDDDLPSIKEFRQRLAELDEEPRPRTIEEARARLQEELAAAREDIARAQAEATFTEEEREAFTIAAQRGEMGEKMREVADRVAAGKETWENVFSNRSPDSPAFAEFLDRAREEQMPDLKRRIEAKDLLR